MAIKKSVSAKSASSTSASELPAPALPAAELIDGRIKELIDGRIKELTDWRGETLAHVRAIIHKAEPAVIEEWKWRGVPVWSRGGILCTGETYKEVVKLTFAKGAALSDPKKLFNSSLEGNVRRAIDIREGEKLNEAALTALIRAAVTLNLEKAKSKKA